MLSSRLLKVAVLGLTMLIAACDRQSGDTAQASGAATAGGELSGTIDRSHRGSALPDFTFRDPAGRSLTLASLRGKPLLLNLWATWCAPCVAELPMLDRLAAENADSLRVLTVSQDSGQPDKVAAFLKERGIARLEPWLDPDNNLAFHFNTGTLPTTIYYDAQGREVWRFVGGHDWAGAGTAKMLAENGGR